MGLPHDRSRLWVRRVRRKAPVFIRSLLLHVLVLALLGLALCARLAESSHEQLALAERAATARLAAAHPPQSARDRERPAAGGASRAEPLAASSAGEQALAAASRAHATAPGRGR